MDIVAIGEANLSALALHAWGHETLWQESKTTQVERDKSKWPACGLKTTSFAFDAEEQTPYREIATPGELGWAGLEPADKRGCRCLRDANAAI